MEQETSTPEKITDQDLLLIERAKTNKTFARLNAEKALAQNEVSELAYNNIILQLMIKYSLKLNDNFDDNGNIIRK